MDKEKPKLTVHVNEDKKRKPMPVVEGKVIKVYHDNHVDVELPNGTIVVHVPFFDAEQAIDNRENRRVRSTDHFFCPKCHQMTIEELSPEIGFCKTCQYYFNFSDKGRPTQT